MTTYTSVGTPGHTDYLEALIETRNALRGGVSIGTQIVFVGNPTDFDILPFPIAIDYSPILHHLIKDKPVDDWRKENKRPGKSQAKKRKAKRKGK